MGGKMGKLSLRLIALGLLILALGSFPYADFLAKNTLSDPAAMLCFGICLIGVGKFGSGKKKR